MNTETTAPSDAQFHMDHIEAREYGDESDYVVVSGRFTKEQALEKMIQLQETWYGKDFEEPKIKLSDIKRGKLDWHYAEHADDPGFQYVFRDSGIGRYECWYVDLT